jgi:hypothetical protein
MNENGLRQSGWTIAVLAIVFLGLTMEYQSNQISFIFYVSLLMLLLTVFWIRGNMKLRGT